MEEGCLAPIDVWTNSAQGLAIKQWTPQLSASVNKRKAETRWLDCTQLNSTRHISLTLFDDLYHL